MSGTREVPDDPAARRDFVPDDPTADPDFNPRNWTGTVLSDDHTCSGHRSKP